jgi:hypothetical protein
MTDGSIDRPSICSLPPRVSPTRTATRPAVATAAPSGSTLAAPRGGSQPADAAQPTPSAPMAIGTLR